jgi:phospholipid/cholesterol/gamma-HCH transport system substrate-binding protein
VSEPGKRTELLVGIFIFIGLALLGALILQFGRFEKLRTNNYNLTVVFDDASGLIRGSEVRMGGARIGRVSETPQLNEEVKVEVEVEISDRIRIPEGSLFQITSASLLGDKLIVITPPQHPTGLMIEPDAIQNNAVAVTEDVIRILAAAESTLGKVDEAILDIRGASMQLQEAMTKVNQSILADENLANIDAAIDNLAAASQGWKNISGDLEPALAEFRSAVQAIEGAAGRADETISELRPTLERMPRAVDSISEAATKAGNAIEDIQAGDGLLGTLTRDESVSTDARDFIRNLRQHGILRYRDAGNAEEDDPRNRFRGRRR